MPLPPFPALWNEDKVFDQSALSGFKLLDSHLTATSIFWIPFKTIYIIILRKSKDKKFENNSPLPLTHQPPNKIVNPKLRPSSLSPRNKASVIITWQISTLNLSRQKRRSDPDVIALRRQSGTWYFSRSLFSSPSRRDRASTLAFSARV